MSSSTKKLMIFLSIFGFSLATQARDSAESFLMLRQAMMKSNKDYNQHKKKMNNEEFERVETWGRRNSATIVINGGGTTNELSEFQQDQNTEGDREISSNLVKNDSF